MISDGVDGDNDVYPIRVNHLGHQYQILTDGTHHVQFYSEEDTKSLVVTPGNQSCYHVHLCKQGITADTGLMLIDLSDTTNWPHQYTDRITLFNIALSMAGSKITEANVSIGWLSDVDATNGDFNVIHCWMVGFPGTNEPRDINEVIDYSWRGYNVHPDSWFGPTSANNVLFQTDVNLFGPDNTTAFPSGNGDLVAFIDWTAGELDVSISLDYTTFET